MNNSWGFNITDRSYKSTKTLIHYIVNAAGRNANFLLNIGPMPNGVVQPEFIDTLKNIGQWMQKNGYAYYGTRGNVISPQDWGVLTARDNDVFVHILKPVKAGYIFLPGLKQKVSKATANNIPVRFLQQKEGVFIYLDGVQQDDIDTIIQLAVK
jgi:alpha-L-fucosidase